MQLGEQFSVTQTCSVTLPSATCIFLLQKLCPALPVTGGEVHKPASNTMDPPVWRLCTFLSVHRVGRKFLFLVATQILLMVPTQILLLVNIVPKKHKTNQTGEHQQQAAWLRPVLFAIWESENP